MPSGRRLMRWVAVGGQNFSESGEVVPRLVRFGGPGLILVGVTIDLLRMAQLWRRW